MTKKLSGDIRREQIADAALAISGEQGVRGVTVAAVAERVGIAPSAVYRHVDGRKGILDAALDRMIGRIIRALRGARAARDNPLDALELYLSRMMEHVLAGRASPRIVFSDEIFGAAIGAPSKALDFFCTLKDELEALFADGQRRGFVRADVPPRQLGVMFVGLYTPSVIMYHASGGDFDLLGQVRAGWSLFRQAVDPKNGEQGNVSNMVTGVDASAT